MSKKAEETASPSSLMAPSVVVRLKPAPVYAASSTVRAVARQSRKSSAEVPKVDPRASFVDDTRTRSSESSNSRGLNMKTSIALKTAELEPIPSASDATDASASIGLLINERTAKRMSWSR